MIGKWKVCDILVVSILEIQNSIVIYFYKYAFNLPLFSLSDVLS